MIDLALIRKYNIPGPRYTSYPTAPNFKADFNEDELVRALHADNRPDAPVSLYFHLPFCEKLCWFCGCTTVITHRHELAAPYIDALEKEIELKSSFVHPDRRVAQLHLGGGTPTFFTPEEISRLGSIITRHFTFSDEIEAGVEIDPRGLTREHIEALRKVGFNRASVGIQDNDPRVQEAVNRIQPLEMTAQTLGWIRAEGFGSISVDLIYGLPFQTTTTFAKTLDEIIALGPDRFAVFNYAHVPWIKKGQKVIEESDLPSPEEKLELLGLSIEKLTSAGYVMIGMDHFARADDELAIAQRAGTLRRNFQGYSTVAGADIHAYGMSAISQTENVYAQNLHKHEAWMDAVTSGRLPYTKGYILTPEDKTRRAIIMELMCHFTTVLDGDHFRREIEALRPLEADGLLTIDGGTITVTPVGRLLVRNIAMVFDEHLAAGGRFSKTV